MNTLDPGENNGKENANAMLRRMGMSLSILGAVIFSAGLAACKQSFGEAPLSRSILILVSGITMLGAGLYLWHSTKETG